ncbi:MAG: M2 family metallopeptidase, partial [Gammaproteobacteria bacterium]|nr:M2 family metallopeptidase [Gammaproteobacteria bacterium]
MTPFNLSLTALLVSSALLLGGCGPQQQHTAAGQAEQKQLTEADAVAFLKDTETKLVQLYKESNRAEWIYSNFITEDTASLAADVNEKLTVEMVQLATAAAKFDQVSLSADSRRKLDKLKLALTLPAPQDAAKTAEMAKIVADLGGIYGKGKYCKADGKCLLLGDMSAIMASSRDYDEQLEMWQ